MTALPQPRIETDLRADLAARDATIERMAQRAARSAETLRLIRGLATDAEVRDDCGAMGNRAMERIAALAAGR